MVPMLPLLAMKTYYHNGRCNMHNRSRNKTNIATDHASSIYNHNKNNNSDNLNNEKNTDTPCRRQTDGRPAPLRKP